MHDVRPPRPRAPIQVSGRSVKSVLRQALRLADVDGGVCLVADTARDLRKVAEEVAQRDGYYARGPLKREDTIMLIVGREGRTVGWWEP